MTPGKDSNDYKSKARNSECDPTFYPHIGGIESIAVNPFGSKSQQVVAQTINGGKQVGRYAAISRIGVEQGNDNANPGGQCDNKQNQEK